MQVKLNFGGFYGSTHEDRIDNIVESWEIYNPNYRAGMVKYAEKYVDFINEFTVHSLKFIELVSPREYNFGTDSITVEMSDGDYARLIEATDDAKLEEMIKEATTPRDGFIPFYTPETLTDEMRAQLAFDVLFEDEETEKEWDDHYNRHCIYDVVGGVM